MTWEKEDALLGTWTQIPRIYTPGDELSPTLRYTETGILTYASVGLNVYNVPDWGHESGRIGNWINEAPL